MEIGSKITGLTDAEVTEQRLRHGQNKLHSSEKLPYLTLLWHIVYEPMFILLAVACSLYFILGEYGEGLMMLVAILIVSSISFFQELRSKNALDALRKLSQPMSVVVRNGQEISILTEELVVNDVMLVQEGNQVPADGLILQSNDFSVDESILTGESFAVDRNDVEGNNRLAMGTTVVSGQAYARVTHVGMQTQLGKLGKSIEVAEEIKTPLQQQINQFVRRMALFGFGAFMLVWFLNYVHTGSMLEGLLFGLTLAMSVLPEEIPVAFSTFMAIGAWRMMQQSILTKSLRTVETLGSATVICLDKTGTITENKMQLAKVYDAATHQLLSIEDCLSPSCSNVLAYAMWASEPAPFDPMEQALHQGYASHTSEDARPKHTMVHEYPLGGIPPMMTHVHQHTNSGDRIIAGKGAAERIIRICKIQGDEKSKIEQTVQELAAAGYRVLGVASAAISEGEYPREQDDFNWHFEGLVALYDPPKHNIQQVLNQFYTAGIKVKMITGDYPATAKAIAAESGFRNIDAILTGDAVMQLSEQQLTNQVNTCNLFARMFPEAKLRVINALKANGEVVAMTGDGVNDGPALKAAHIGVAMGGKGTEIAKRAAELVLLDDDLEKMIQAIALGRKIYTNLKKAVRYIVSIHIPIILTVTLPLVLGWKYPNIFTPVHVIFLELVMGPTCSIIYENEPIERDTMQRPPRNPQSTFLSFRELGISLVQGLVITAGVLGMYAYAVSLGYNEALTRSLTFSTLLFCNIFLTLVNRSFTFSIFTTLAYPNKLIPIIILITLLLMVLMFKVPFMERLFGLESVPGHLLLLSGGVAMVAVLWVEVYKQLRYHLHLPRHLSAT
ncbi:cation-translocating P-type ATPase [Pontibacter vulgaris]|uniref:cation-translocating P-type ATPase n=1 Tax=Pontibacter vulgaris TaxID=2905679 RepID=UPI001FA6C71C|nr:cation-translocating P-type ATPase [Pontibacter vulgaris]